MRQRGFTLYELLIVVAVLGIMSPLLLTDQVKARFANADLYLKNQQMTNKSLADALMNYAAVSTAYGTLPAPYTGSGYVSAVADPSNAALMQAILQMKVPPTEINNDGYASQRVRVYQLVSNLTQVVPLYYQSGPSVTLVYQEGRIYTTTCAKSNNACNPTPATGIPGASAVLTSANLGTWSVNSGDLAGSVMGVSTNTYQKMLLRTTAEQIDRVRDALGGYGFQMTKTVSAGDTTNWFPGSGKGGLTPSASNNYCHDGWYALNDPSNGILAAAGLTTTQYGTTAWGGTVEYCRDYDQAGKAEGAPPHYAALRINNKPFTGSAAQNPDPAGTNNIVLPL